MALKKRECRGIELFKVGGVEQISQSHFSVSSQRGEGHYEVNWVRKSWECNCPDFRKDRGKCKHVYAVHYHLTMTNILSKVKGTEAQESQLCPLCSSATIVKRGFRYSRSGPAQRYFCKSCRQRFTFAPIGQLKSRAAVVMAALDLYFRGLSLRQTCEHLESYWNAGVSYTTVMRWIKKFVEMANKAGEREPRIRSDRWNADETVVKLSRRHILFWTLMDEKHRFLLALKISSHRTIKDAKSLIESGLKKTGYPREVVTDGALVYPPAISESFPANPGLIHVTGPGLLGAVNNNKVERFHGVLKTRLRTMGTFRSEVSAEAFASGYALYYNYIKPHRSLGGRTPAEAIGLADSKLTWKDLLVKSGKKSLNVIGRAG